jgi:DNA-binding CsgD family transcriptional regulator
VAWHFRDVDAGVHIHSLSWCADGEVTVVRLWSLFDRENEVARLAELARRSMAGSGEFAIIEGPAGIGKSRLLQEVLAVVGEPEEAVLTVRCSQLERDATFGVVRRLVEPVIASATPSRRAALLDGAASPSAAIFDNSSAGWEGSSEFGAFHALYWLIANLCQERPRILVVDDVHWCDGPSLRFLAYLVHRSSDLALTVLMAARPDEPGVETRLLDHIATEPACCALQLGPLTIHGGTRLLTAQLGEDAHPDFVQACYRATAGNPLLLLELTDQLMADGIRPTADNAQAIMAMGSRTVARWVRHRMGPLEADVVEMAEAVAVLGDGVDFRSACAVAEVPVAAGLDIVDQLGRADIVRTGPGGLDEGVDFVHPLVREAIYNGMDRSSRSKKHARAVQVLTLMGSDVESVAAHVLLTQTETTPPALSVLRAAARQATSRGAPDGAVMYLRRSLQEEMPADERAALLFELGAIAQLVDLPTAAGFLRQALDYDASGPRAAMIGGMLGGVLLQMGDSEYAVEAVTNAIKVVDPADADLRHRLDALLLNVPILEPGWQDLVPESLPAGPAIPEATIGRRMADAVYSLHETFACNSLGPSRAESALADDVLIREISGEGALVCGWLSMLAADNPAVMASLDAAIAYAHRYGSTRGVSPAYALRGLAWLWQGQLADAEADLIEAKSAVDTGNISIGRLFTGPYLADALAAQGHLSRARETLNWVTGRRGVPLEGPSYFYMLSDARLLRLCRDAEAGLHAAIRCGEHYALHGGDNPALVPWRSEAALCLGELGRTSDGLAYADEELALTRTWGAPRALGRALRVMGTLTKGTASLDLLRESTEILHGTRANLERAESLIAYGTRLNKLSRTTDGKYFLREGLELAEMCGAAALVAAGRRELIAAGARPRRLALTGVRSLTPSERRIVKLAAHGNTNREIAQTLFITAKTVEIHLTAAYKKLDVHGREELAPLLDESPD